MESTATNKSLNGLENDRWSLREYFDALVSMVKRPGEFFGNFPENPGYRRSLAFLLLSSLFFAGAGLAANLDRQMEITLVLWVNALGMPVISAALCFAALTLTTRRRQSFALVFAVFAYASGTTMLLSWIPWILFATELWKWYLVGLGLVKVFGLKWSGALLMLGITLVSLFLFFYSIFPIVSAVKVYF